MALAASPPMSVMAGRARFTCESRSRAADAGGRIADVLRRLPSISARHHDSRPPAHAAVQIQDIRVEHADAAVGHEASDRAGLLGAVDTLFPAAQGHAGLSL